jgi:hypothetical protein
MASNALSAVASIVESITCVGDTAALSVYAYVVPVQGVGLLLKSYPVRNNSISGILFNRRRSNFKYNVLYYVYYIEGGTIMPDTSEGLEQAIRQAASEASEVSTSLGSVKQRTLQELIEADRYLRSLEVNKQPSRAIKFIRLIPNGAV